MKFSAVLRPRRMQLAFVAFSIEYCLNSASQLKCVGPSCLAAMPSMDICICNLSFLILSLLLGAADLTVSVCSKSRISLPAVPRPLLPALLPTGSVRQAEQNRRNCTDHGGVPSRPGFRALFRSVLWGRCLKIDTCRSRLRHHEHIGNKYGRCLRFHLCRTRWFPEAPHWRRPAC